MADPIPTTPAARKPAVLLFATDFSDASRFAATTAREHAMRAAPSELHIVHVLEAMVAPMSLEVFAVENTGTVLGQALEDARVRLQALCREVECGANVTIKGHLRVGASAAEVIALAQEIAADEIVVGSHGRRGFTRIVLGSVAEHIVQKAPCSVTVARPRDASGDLVIEAACRECIAVREASKGESQWCARHAEHHPRAHTYADKVEGVAGGWQSILGSQQG